MRRALVLFLVMKPKHARPTTTHFEQVPLKVVKRIAVPAPSKAARARPHNLTIGPASRKTEPYSMLVGSTKPESVERDADPRRELIQRSSEAIGRR